MEVEIVTDVTPLLIFHVLLCLPKNTKVITIKNDAEIYHQCVLLKQLLLLFDGKWLSVQIDWVIGRLGSSLNHTGKVLLPLTSK